MNKGVYRIGLSLSEVNKYFELPITEDDFEHLLSQSNLKYKAVESRETFLSSIQSVIGKPYKRGASVLYDAPEYFDCSSLVSWAAVEAGLSIPRISIDQYVYSQRINKEDIVPGDLIFANTKEIIHTDGKFFSKILQREVEEQPIRTETVEYLPGTKVPEGVDHVGIYSGANTVTHASTKTGGVVSEDLDVSNSFKNIIGYGRIFKNNEKRFVIEIPKDRPDLRSRDLLLKSLANK